MQATLHMKELQMFTYNLWMGAGLPAARYNVNYFVQLSILR